MLKKYKQIFFCLKSSYYGRLFSTVEVFIFSFIFSFRWDPFRLTIRKQEVDESYIFHEFILGNNWSVIRNRRTSRGTTEDIAQTINCYFEHT